MSSTHNRLQGGVSETLCGVRGLRTESAELTPLRSVYMIAGHLFKSTLQRLWSDGQKFCCIIENSLARHLASTGS